MCQIFMECFGGVYVLERLTMSGWRNDDDANSENEWNESFNYPKKINVDVISICCIDFCLIDFCIEYKSIWNERILYDMLNNELYLSKLLNVRKCKSPCGSIKVKILKTTLSICKLSEIAVKMNKKVSMI